ncbi:MAG: fatty acid desaturase [Verrucomicrobiota bacterium]
MSEQTESLKKKSRAKVAQWKKLVAEFQKSCPKRASWQLVNTFGSYIALWTLMYFALKVSWWLALPLAIVAGGIVIRAFIILHDCGHGSFFKSKKANDFWGSVCGFITFTPYHHWRWEHSIHHATSGDLDRRGVGDIWTMTVEEYNESSGWRKFGYRLVRNPFVLFVFAPIYLFLLRERFPSPKAGIPQRNSVYFTNIALLCIAMVMSLTFGLWTYLLLQFIVIAVAAASGVWLFYVQHQFEDAYWEHSEEWDYTEAAIKGSSFYKLPKVLQWFSGNIGFHHIHHLSPSIPNYNLERCHDSDPLFKNVKPLTFFKSFKSMTYRLWDEAGKKLITFKEYRKLNKERAEEAKTIRKEQAEEDAAVSRAQSDLM